jgi:Fe-S cluster assembly protein SufD
MGRARQLVDHHTAIDHALPHTTSRQLYKGILDGRARGVFRGRVHVRPQAQKIDAAQTNRNLLLSDDAVANSNPQLEIYADDVKCSHGATIGRLSDEAIFYLRSRGISLADSRRLLTLAFANEILASLPAAELRSELAGGAASWLEPDDGKGKRG